MRERERERENEGGERGRVGSGDPQERRWEDQIGTYLNVPKNEDELQERKRKRERKEKEKKTEIKQKNRKAGGEKRDQARIEERNPSASEEKKTKNNNNQYDDSILAIRINIHFIMPVLMGATQAEARNGAGLVSDSMFRDEKALTEVLLRVVSRHSLVFSILILVQRTPYLHGHQTPSRHRPDGPLPDTTPYSVLTRLPSLSLFSVLDNTCTSGRAQGISPHRPTPPMIR